MIEKLKELSKDTAIYGISTMLGRFLGFLLIPFYTNVFTTADYGIYSYLYTIIGFMNVIYIYGMDAAYLKFASISSEEEKQDTFSTPFLIIAITSTAASLLIFSLKSEVSIFLDVPNLYTHLIVYMIIILLLDTIALIPFSGLRLERKAKKFAIIKTLNILINITLNLVLILKYKMGIEAIFISNIIASAFSLLALIPEIIRRIKPKINFILLKKLLKFGLPYLPASLAAMMVQMIDVPILREMTNDSTVGIYRANYKMGIFMLLFVSMFQYAWQPFFLNNAKEKNAKEIFSKVLTLFVLTSSIIWIFVTLFIDNLAMIEFFKGKTIIGKNYLVGIYIVPIILFAYMFHGMYVNFTAGLYIEEKTNYFPAITSVGALVNIASNFLLIPIYGIMGAAISTLASYLIMALSIFLVTNKFYKIKYEFNRIIPNLLLVLVTIIIYYYLYFSHHLIMGYKIILLCGFLISLYIFKIINKKEIQTAFQIIKGKK